MNKAERQNKLISILRVNKHDKIENLAMLFGVSVRTIQNDILELSIDYPLDTLTGRYNGGVYWDLYNTWKGSNDDELKLLDKIKLLLKDNKDKEVLEKIIRKIKLA